VRYRLPPLLPTSRATPEKLSQPSVAPDDLSPCWDKVRTDFGEIEDGYCQAIDLYRIALIPWGLIANSLFNRRKWLM
jgi:hypothetical protein